MNSNLIRLRPLRPNQKKEMKRLNSLTYFYIWTNTIQSDQFYNFQFYFTIKAVTYVPNNKRSRSTISCTTVLYPFIQPLASSSQLLLDVVHRAGLGEDLTQLGPDARYPDVHTTMYTLVYKCVLYFPQFILVHTRDVKYEKWRRPQRRVGVVATLGGPLGGGGGRGLGRRRGWGAGQARGGGWGRSATVWLVLGGGGVLSAQQGVRQVLLQLPSMDMPDLKQHQMLQLLLTNLHHEKLIWETL